MHDRRNEVEEDWSRSMPSIDFGGGIVYSSRYPLSKICQVFLSGFGGFRLLSKIKNHLLWESNTRMDGNVAPGATGLHHTRFT